MTECPYCDERFNEEAMEQHRPACYLALAETENRKTSLVEGDHHEPPVA